MIVMAKMTASSPKNRDTGYCRSQEKKEAFMINEEVQGSRTPVMPLPLQKKSSLGAIAPKAACEFDWIYFLNVPQWAILAPK